MHLVCKRASAEPVKLHLTLCRRGPYRRDSAAGPGGGLHDAHAHLLKFLPFVPPCAGGGPIDEIVLLDREVDCMMPMRTF